ncbi:MAG TPA: UDP-N-acetylglucosamine 2-epimerase (non-hydrolyzing) [Dissulfurispiraceae bacterium]|nr:UDP-N-acetylglucosamine 2-epimerase (non-hydrolyzing) [Dissulfurispiraceae bacterium]
MAISNNGSNTIVRYLPMRVAAVVGTRPEAIKMAPVIHELRKSPDLFDVIVIATAQHRQMLDQALSLFEIIPNHDLNLMYPGQSLSLLTSRVIDHMDLALSKITPDMVLVQGDTTTVFAASLAAYYRKIPVAHVEAGLRSYDMLNPFPEEGMRRLTTILAEINFAPTRLSKAMLLDEGIHEDKIVVTGNTVVDALNYVLKKPFSCVGTPLEDIDFDNFRCILVTCHRRETIGRDLEEICLALHDIIDGFPDVRIIYPVHLNPEVQRTVMSMLSGIDRVHLIPPLDYLTFINLMKRVHLILTDSGGLQEEAPTLHKPLLVLRRVTERPEAFKAGLSKVIGTARETIVHETASLLNDTESFVEATHGNNPYGDGKASLRIAQALNRWSHGKLPLLDSDAEFVYSAGDKINEH